MKTTLQKVVDFLYSVLSKVKGHRATFQLPPNGDNLQPAMVVSIGGFVVSFYCQEFRYVTKYKNRFVTDNAFSTFKVYATTTVNAPEKLKKAIESDIYLPIPTNVPVKPGTVKKLLLETYFDILIQKLELDGSSI